MFRSRFSTYLTMESDAAASCANDSVLDSVVWILQCYAVELHLDAVVVEFDVDSVCCKKILHIKLLCSAYESTPISFTNRTNKYLLM